MHIPSLVLMKKCILLCLWRGYITWRFNLNKKKKRLLLQTKSIALCWTSSYQHINCNFALFALTSSSMCFQSLAHPLCWNQDNYQWIQGGAQNKHLQKCSFGRHPTRIKQNSIPGVLLLEQLFWDLMLGRFLFTSSEWQDPNPFVSILTKLSLHFHHPIGWRTNSCKSFFTIFPLKFFKPMSPENSPVKNFRVIHAKDLNLDMCTWKDSAEHRRVRLYPCHTLQSQETGAVPKVSFLWDFKLH